MLAVYLYAGETRNSVNRTKFLDVPGAFPIVGIKLLIKPACAYKLCKMLFHLYLPPS